VRKLVLFVASFSPNSTIALVNLRKALEQSKNAELHLEVVDVDDDPERTLAWRILVTPTLVWGDWPFQGRLVGDLSAERELTAFLTYLPGGPLPRIPPDAGT
jgi:hypothetical protein